MKICVKCKAEKDEEQFPFQHYKRADGTKARRTECRTCMNKKRDERRKKIGNSEGRKKAINRRNSKKYHENEEIRERARIRSRNNTLRKYGMVEKDYQRMLEEQDYRCKICTKPAEECQRGILDVDHCHSTGKVRGLLCTDCNGGLGKFRDNIEFIKEAIKYLESRK